MDDEEKLKDHPVKCYNGFVSILRSLVNKIDFPIKKVNRLMMICTRILMDEYENADESKKKKMEDKFKAIEKTLIDEKFLPDPNKEKKHE